MTTVPQPKAGRLVAVVVTHDRLAKLRPTLRRLLDCDPAHLQAIVVVDNASGDGTAEWLDGMCDPRLHVLHSAENLGGAGGFDRGMRYAMKRFDPDWLVVMDDDARPDRAAFEMFQSRFRPDDIAWAAAVFFPDGRICEMNRPSVNPFWSLPVFLRTLVRGRDGYHIPHRAYAAATPCPIDLTSFVGLFLSRRIIDETGYPDPGLFLYGDDVIYTLTLRRKGLRILFDPSLRFEHDCSTYDNDRRRVFRPLWKTYYMYRNGLLMYHEAAGVLFWLLLPLLVVKWHLAARRYGAGRRTYLKLKRRAIRDALRKHTDRSHADILALAEMPVSGSECRDDSAPEEAGPGTGRPG